MMIRYEIDLGHSSFEKRGMNLGGLADSLTDPAREPTQRQSRRGVEGG
jgi:hypothetical protein